MEWTGWELCPSLLHPYSVHNLKIYKKYYGGWTENKAAMHVWTIIHGPEEKTWMRPCHSGCIPTQNKFQDINRF